MLKVQQMSKEQLVSINDCGLFIKIYDAHCYNPENQECRILLILPVYILTSQ